MANTYPIADLPLGTSDPRALYDNSSNFDEAVNGPNPTWVDRQGDVRKSWSSMETDLYNTIAQFGFEFIGDYVANSPLTVSRPNQVFSRNGEYWHAAPSLLLPYTTTANWTVDGPKFYSVGDAQLRAELAGVNGAELVHWRGLPLSIALAVFPEHYGAKGDGLTDDSAAFQSALNGLPEYGVLFLKNGSTYKLTAGASISKKGTTITGGGKILYPKTSAPYYHCLRVNAHDVTIRGVVIESPPGLARDDTGFGILIGAFDNCVIEGCTVRYTGSAAIWASGSTNFRIIGNRVFYPLADGIHVSDACRNGIIANNEIMGTHDDALAVVGDTPSAAAPINISVVNNVVDGTIAGHACVLIACDTVLVKGNIFRGAAAAGIGSYFWQLTGAPVAKDWANYCVIEGNTIIAPGVGQLNVNNAAGMFLGAAKNWEVRGNSIAAPSSEALALASCMRVIACQGLLIEGNNLHDSASYGVWNPEINANGALNFTGLVIRKNYFKNIQKQAIRLSSASDMGVTQILGNDFHQCAYDSATTSVVYVAKTGSNLLNISDNRNVDGTKDLVFDVATCSNFKVSDNTPEIPIAYNPAIASSGGAFTSVTSAGRYLERGPLIFFKVTGTITTKGNGTGIRFNLPRPMRGGSPPFIINGFNSSLGTPIFGRLESLTSVAMFTATNGDPTTADGQAVDISGWYERA